MSGWTVIEGESSCAIGGRRRSLRAYGLKTYPCKPLPTDADY